MTLTLSNQLVVIQSVSDSVRSPPKCMSKFENFATNIAKDRLQTLQQQDF